MAYPRTICIATLALATVTRIARADPSATTGTDGDRDVARRLAWIERVIEREGAATRVWQWSWVGFYGAVTIAEGALLATAKTPPDRVNDGVSAGKAAVALGFVLASPASAAPSARALRSKPAGTAAERLAKLRHGESILRHLAQEERERRGWFPLIGGALLNAGGGFITWAAYRGSGANGWFGVASGLAVAQLQFHTQPTGAIRAWDAYQRAADGGRLGEPPAVLRWSITPTAGGMAVTGAF
jgi:hypothetical protein